MGYLHGKFVWFEHVSDDLERARRFYGGLFGWNSDPAPMGESSYHMIVNGAQGIGGFRSAMPGVPNHWMSYLSVADVDAAASAATQAGARLLMPPTDFGPVGRAATLSDPQGAVFSIWKDAQRDREDLNPVPIGDWYWHELTTTDDGAALGFYEGVFGFRHSSGPVPGGGTYYMLERDGIQRAGLMKMDMPGVPPAWTPYVRVADCDASCARAIELGATQLVAPMDVPNVGRFALIADPVGAVIGLFKGEI
jgi:hypothetical protein